MIVVDTSVAVKWVVAEERRAEAREVLASGLLLEAPDLMVLEAASTLRKKVRLRQIGIDQMSAGLEVIRQTVGFQTTRVFFDEALALSSELDHSIYDCCFLACARSNGSLLVTDDTVFARKCHAGRYGVHVLELANVRDGGLERALGQVPYVDPFSRLEAE